MFTSIRQSSGKLRLWLLAAAAILFLTSVLEAGHAHGVVTAADDNCILCQHSVALDKVLNSAISIVITLLLAVLVLSHTEAFIACSTIHSAHIRAPPVQLHSR